MFDSFSYFINLCSYMSGSNFWGSWKDDDVSIFYYPFNNTHGETSCHVFIQLQTSAHKTFCFILKILNFYLDFTSTEHV